MTPDEGDDATDEADEQPDEGGAQPSAEDTRRAEGEVAASPAAGVVDPDLDSPPEPSEPA